MTRAAADGLPLGRRRSASANPRQRHASGVQHSCPSA